MYDAFTWNPDLIDNEDKSTNSARKMVLKIVNSLSAKMEIGAPMAALCLLGNPDHYTSHTFTPFYWKNFVSFVQTEWDLFIATSNPPATDEDLQDEGIKRVNTVKDEPDEDDDVRGDECVEIRNKQGNFVGKSSTDDYRLRPAQLEAVSLYEWIQCSIWHKISSHMSMDANLNWYNYLPDHALSDSHLVACDPARRMTVVPNFIGPALPRKDHGDRENYCCTMLTFFRPWRMGLDLKSPDESWDDAFNAYPFTDRQEQLMRNFNIRYECYDARDDFVSASKKDDQQDNVVNEDDERGAVDDRDEPWEDYIMGELGPEGQSHLDMVAMNEDNLNALKNAGWQNNKGLCESMRNNLNLPQVTVDQHLHASKWNRIIQAEKRLLWRRRFQAALVPTQTDAEGVMGRTVRNDAYVVSSSFFSQNFVPADIQWSEVMDQIIVDFSLNQEQRKAFRIIANHATCIAPDQLLMYLGGMGGTGKSTVIRALEAFFNRRKEPYRFVLLAPTGTASALLGGTTYHSFLGFRTSGAGISSQSDVIERLSVVGYVLLDEISMLSLGDVCRISACCCEALNVFEKPFGGLNVIFAGDFAQLPPAQAMSLYNRSFGLKQNVKQKPPEQEHIIGKSIWLQFTAVVILKENMRQVDEDPDEQAFRDALSNLRYSSCTDADIAVFKSHVVTPGNGLSVDSPEYKNVSIITARNQDKDHFNESGSICFAAEVGENLHEFYSIDELSNSEPKRPRNPVNPKVFSKATVMTNVLQEDLWVQPPFTSEHIPARLQLCKGLPVLIRNNTATDLCITRGQEAHVVGWTSKKLQSGRRCLEVVYLELIKPPHDVKVLNLPRNVVPLTRISETVDARLSTDEYVHISCSQIPILPNFAMTDYSAQGKTREYNVIDLTRCRNFQGMYTQLSRGKALSKTLILRDFSPKLMQEELNGYLRQEYRELNYLDTITDLRYKGELPEWILQPTRWATIARYKQWKGNAIKKSWHLAIQKVDELDQTEHLMVNNNLDPLSKPMKRKSQADDQLHVAKRQKTDKQHGRLTAAAWLSPVGPLWDSRDYSCAWDSWTFILHSVFQDNGVQWMLRLRNYGEVMTCVVNSLRMMDKQDPVQEMVDLRNAWRSKMRDLEPGRYGNRGVDILHLSHRLLDIDGEMMVDNVPCPDCGRCKPTALARWNPVEDQDTIQDYVNDKNREIADCHLCRSRVEDLGSLRDLLCFEVNHRPNLALNTRLDVRHWGPYRMAGIIYFGNFHFVARAVTKLDKVYGHDGMDGTYSVFHGFVGEQQHALPIEDLKFYGQKKASLVIYVKDGVNMRD